MTMTYSITVYIQHLQLFGRKFTYFPPFFKLDLCIWLSIVIHNKQVK